ncbi:signal recognition particle-docking protein FtsY [Synechococcus sp. PCC 6312]|uniref:signal recognition particle-docking protein FtsY n=1 Tax=Synechococcus sp. (strain ATCC 27167 / PCC 6312) TaxID=195253 RepID=UPI00029EC6F6|nr:signal recognition particle-docking protein FtsY [Synechococcus sp. PCC 6312]AFY59726.1 signal recognition particle-docking protein FtsY [Synechococcus sp. PCC 6312]
MFNWFRRALGKTEDNATVENQPASSVTEVPETTHPETTTNLAPDAPIAPPEPEATPTPEPETKVDYLAWAKAAFNNIQARQSPNIAPSSPPSEVSYPAISPATPTTEFTESSDSPVMTAELSESPPPESPPTITIQASTPVPITETPESESFRPELSPTLPEPAPIPLALDEGFLWSAEVLASQGRRPEDVDIEEITWLQKLRQGLGKTRRGLVNQLKAVVGRGPLGADAVEEIESLLLQADVGVAATDKIIQALQTKIRQDALPADQAIDYLKQILRDVLEEPFQKGYDPNFAPQKQRLNIWLMTGVNGVGKTTTIGKIAHVASTSGYLCLVAAADTFRAAAVEQVKIWAARSGVEVIANPGKNTDPAAVVFDGISAAQSRHCELLLIDTAGRLQNKQNLMEELRKIRRIVDKKAPDAHIESLLVLDASLGQNGLRQAQVFAEAAQLTGVVITKLDGTAKGGVALAVVQELGLPIRFIGAGEGIKDLRPFSSYEFVEALLSG